ncbi:hypothetical protein GUITHDRAFT_155920 [Guillardia theta CCMP2712]|uniref:protein-disulfide reductase n=2 Tax=Guillardia theta TaxID=55529 RepID=L1IDF0_GUITC|nr:hypothetical protein GUITHDRAFT_155920 [Guillardia theta CCMP2712]EKX33845.1 hypothetical protein GUITHDRAFT_155920 [Guillardia theta CCMP2712]|eukprot:XP_005820825.1 hypothetical protein GUITHDRAFT_155920 [Guillardia theta CCMP2712]
MQWCVVHDVEAEAVTLSWSKVPNAVKYEVQIKQEEGGDFTTISDSLTSTLVRKKNLKPNTEYFARVRHRDALDWSGFCEPVSFHTLAGQDVKRLEHPQVVSRDGESITLQWPTAPDCESYTVEIRSDKDPTWRTISDHLKNNIVRKKNLEKHVMYYFRVKPNLAEGSGSWFFSPPSEGAMLADLPPFLSNLLSPTLVDAQGTSKPVSSLAGCVVALYCSASWCGPCRQFTPQLSQFYTQMKQLGKPFEVVFLSCDRDSKSFTNYFGHMPWLAVPFDSDKRENALGALQVEGIPKLVIVGANGMVLQDNAVGTPLNAQKLDSWIAGRP